MRFIWYIETRHQRTVVGLAVVLVLIVTYADWITGPELSFSIFYVLPVALATLAGIWAGVLMSVLAATGWFVADALANPLYSYPLVPYWNALVQLALYLTVAYIVSALQQSRLMQRELTEFMVHDLKSPLTTIRAALQTYSRSCEPSDQEGVGTVLRAGLSSLERLSMMINALLDVARAEEATLQTSPQVVQVVELVDATVEQMRPWAVDLQVELVTHAEAQVSTAYADPDLTTRVLTNLLSNAIKYSPPLSQVIVNVARHDDSRVRLAVTDQGPGVPREWLTRVFGKFEQVRARLAGAAVGSGLGLAFCKLAVQAQGGQIWMESEPGVRTTVSFTLPTQP